MHAPRGSPAITAMSTEDVILGLTLPWLSGWTMGASAGWPCGGTNTTAGAAKLRRRRPDSTITRRRSATKHPREAAATSSRATAQESGST